MISDLLYFQDFLITILSSKKISVCESAFFFCHYVKVPSKENDICNIFNMTN